MKALGERKTAARARAMAAMTLNAAKFSMSMGNLSNGDDDDEEEAEEAVGGKKNGDQQQQGPREEDDDSGGDEEEPSCIICQAGSESEDICWLFLSQETRLLSGPRGVDSEQQQGPVLHVEPSKPFLAPVVDGEGELHFSSCGHAIHSSCFDQYFAGIVDRSERENGLILDTSKGHFPCPLCKKLNSFLCPITRCVKNRKRAKASSKGSPLAHSSSLSLEATAEAKEEAEMEAALNWISAPCIFAPRLENVAPPLILSLPMDDRGDGEAQSAPVSAAPLHPLSSLSPDRIFFWKRFMIDACEPLLGPGDSFSIWNDRNFAAGVGRSDFLVHLEVVLAGISATACLDELSGGPTPVMRAKLRSSA